MAHLDTLNNKVGFKTIGEKNLDVFFKGEACQANSVELNIFTETCSGNTQEKMNNHTLSGT